MGIKNFSKIFTPVKITSFKKINESGKKLVIAIDAMTELFRSSLGANNINTLTDKYGRPTLPISVMLYNIVEFHKNNIDQIWVFDYEHLESDKDFHNPEKKEEVEKRLARRKEEQKKLDQLLIKSESTDEDSEQFFDMSIENELLKNKIKDSTDLDNIDKKDTVDDIKTKESINNLEKRVFTVSKDLINSLKFILDCLNIKYIDSPKGFEGEQIASYLSSTGQIDGVYSSDSDPIAFGAKYLYKKNALDKKIYHYTQKDIFRQMSENLPNIKPNMNRLREICVASGTDFAEKIPKLGPKTILKKYIIHVKNFSEKQKKAIQLFKKEPNTDIETNNLDKEPFTNDKRKELINWLVEEKSFNKDRMNKLLLNV